ncbi:hypothetical protein SB6419_00071 [Klebsiella spallanzanii]|nr:hypothetical protein SB6419_00071 [Klebsiella spallanzanii]
MHSSFVIRRHVQSKKILLLLQILPEQYLEGAIPVILQVACALALLLGSSMSLALRAAGIRRSNLFQTDLSLTPVTYFSKLLGI